MELKKARDIAILYAQRDAYAGAIKEFASETRKSGSVGNTTITVPVSWLPAISKIAEEELAKIDEEIASL